MHKRILCDLHRVNVIIPASQMRTLALGCELANSSPRGLSVKPSVSMRKRPALH